MWTAKVNSCDFLVRAGGRRKKELNPETYAETTGWGLYQGSTGIMGLKKGKSAHEGVVPRSQVRRRRGDVAEAENKSQGFKGASSGSRSEGTAGGWQ